MYNEIENKYYVIKENYDCVFNRSCLLVPDNFSFMNYKRPYHTGHFYSEKNEHVFPVTRSTIIDYRRDNSK